MSKDFYKQQGLPDFVPDPNPKKQKNTRVTLLLIAIGVAVLAAGFAFLVTYFMVDETTEKSTLEVQRKTDRQSAKKEKNTEQMQDKMGRIIIAAPFLNREGNLYLWLLTEKRNTGDNNIYIFNPGSDSILINIKADYPLSKSLKVYSINKKVWIIKDESNPEIHAYDSENGQELFNPRSFTGKYSEFEPGLSNISLEKSYPGICYKIIVKDGKEHYYDFETEEIVPYNTFKQKAYNSKDYKTPVTIYKLFPERQSQGRYILYKVTAPKYRMSSYSMMFDYDDKGNVKLFDGTAKPIMPEKIFFSGRLIFQDKKYIIISHKKSFEDKNENMLTCASTDGVLLWEKLLSDINSFTGKINSSRFEAELYDDILVFQDGESFAAGLDISTGDVKWNLKF